MILWGIRLSWGTIIKIILAVLASVGLALVYSPNSLDGYAKTGRLLDISYNIFNNKIKYVLYWNLFTNITRYSIGYGSEPFKYCQYKNCFITDDRAMVPLEDFDVIIFHMLHYNKTIHKAPWIRLPHQMYIYMNVEAPTHLCPELNQYRDYFNWTMTYRFDSDIIKRYGFVTKTKTNYVMPSEEFVNNKTKLAAWFVSNCRTGSKREILTKAIQKFMPVDVYGSCGNLTCKRKSKHAKTSPPECYEMVERDYKFYFSFENAYCKDYSTEKLYKILEKDVVPVAYGAGDYKDSAPPNSVINVEDFERVEDLAAYLRYLDGNVEEYLKYFEWKREYSVTLRPLSNACQICQKLHEPIKTSIYNNLHEWWWGTNKTICKKNKALPPIVSGLL